jgi:hypothetical protein
MANRSGLERTWRLLKGCVNSQIKQNFPALESKLYSSHPLTESQVSWCHTLNCWISICQGVLVYLFFSRLFCLFRFISHLDLDLLWSNPKGIRNVVHEILKWFTCNYSCKYLTWEVSPTWLHGFWMRLIPIGLKIHRIKVSKLEE